MRFEMKFLVLAFMIGIFGQVSYGSTDFSCSTPTGKKSFIVSKGQVKFDVAEFSSTRRVPSNIRTLQTKNSKKTFTQTLLVDGTKHVVHIDDKKELSEANDYLWVISKKGHKFLYPINCKQII